MEIEPYTGSTLKSLDFYSKFKWRCGGFQVGASVKTSFTFKKDHSRGLGVEVGYYKVQYQTTKEAMEVKISE